MNVEQDNIFCTKRIGGVKMQELRKQRETDKFIIVDVIVDGKIVGWSVTDKQLQRVTEEIFETASMAFGWAENEQ